MRKVRVWGWWREDLFLPGAWIKRRRRSSELEDAENEARVGNLGQKKNLLLTQIATDRSQSIRGMSYLWPIVSGHNLCQKLIFWLVISQKYIIIGQNLFGNLKRKFLIKIFKNWSQVCDQLSFNLLLLGTSCFSEIILRAYHFWK